MSIDWQTLISAVALALVIGGLIARFFKKDVIADVTDIIRDDLESYVKVDTCKILHQNSNKEITNFKEDVKISMKEIKGMIKDIQNDVKESSRIFMTIAERMIK